MPDLTPAERRSVKPTIRHSSVRWLDAINEYVREYGCRGDALRLAASDVLCGWAEREELDDLIRRRFLQVIRFSAVELKDEWGEFAEIPSPELCGRGWDVVLTERAVKVFWPERASERNAE
jgi:hypothetical protein